MLYSTDRTYVITSLVRRPTSSENEALDFYLNSHADILSRTFNPIRECLVLETKLYLETLTCCAIDHSFCQSYHRHLIL